MSSMSLDRVGEADARGGPGKPRIICCVATNRASGSISVGILKHRVRARLTHRHRSFEPEEGCKTMLCATISLERLPSHLSRWRHSDGPNPVVDESSLGR
jgi:hypothetical protein